MKLVITTAAPYIGGNETAIKYLSRELANLNYKITLIVKTNPEHLPYFRKFNWLHDLIPDMNDISFSQIHKRIRPFKPDCLLDSNSTNLAGMLSIALKKPCFTRIVCHPKWWCVENVPEHLLFTRITTQKFVTVSDFIKRAFTQHGIDNISRIYEGCDTSRFKPSPAKGENFRKRHKIGSDTFVILMLAHFNRQKRHKIFLETADKLRKTTKNFVCLFVGKSIPGDMENNETEIRSIVAEKKLDAHVKFIGYLSNPSEAINASDLSVYPSEDEGFGMSVIEVMACSKPVLVNNTGAYPELIEDGINGFSVPYGNPDAFADKILSLIEDPVRLKIAADRGREDVLKHYRVENTARNYDSFFKENI